MFGFINKLVGQKKSEYYLELKEDEQTQAETKTTKSSSPKPQVVAEPKKAEPAKQLEPVATTPTKKDTKPEPVAATPAKEEKKPEPVATTVNTKQAEVTPTQTTFAPNNLLSNGSASRRRPGANMSSYLDMALQVKKPS